MPKRFKRAIGQAVIVSPSAAIRRPALAIDIANIASHWSNLEQTLSMPHTMLLAGQEQSAFEAYHELFDISLRHKMFLAVARHKRVSQELIKESETLHQKVRKTASSRKWV